MNPHRLYFDVIDPSTLRDRRPYGRRRLARGWLPWPARPQVEQDRFGLAGRGQGRPSSPAGYQPFDLASQSKASHRPPPVHRLGQDRRPTAVLHARTGVNALRDRSALARPPTSIDPKEAMATVRFRASQRSTSDSCVALGLGYLARLASVLLERGNRHPNTVPTALRPSCASDHTFWSRNTVSMSADALRKMLSSEPRLSSARSSVRRPQ